MIRSQSGSEFGNLSPHVSANTSTFSNWKRKINYRINHNTKNTYDVELEEEYM